MTTHRIARHNEVISSAEAFGLKQPPPRRDFRDGALVQQDHQLRVTPSRGPTERRVHSALDVLAMAKPSQAPGEAQIRELLLAQQLQIQAMIEAGARSEAALADERKARLKQAARLDDALAEIVNLQDALSAASTTS
jgi:hypothetical protein